MSVSAVGSSSVAMAQQTLSAALESGEIGPDRDGDADDRGGVTTTAAPPVTPSVTPAATVNSLGEVVGATISTKA